MEIKNDLETLVNVLENSMREQGYKTKKLSQIGIFVTKPGYDGLIFRAESGKEYELTIGESIRHDEKSDEWQPTNYLKDDEATTMKFYEFNSPDFGYFALIGAISEENAMKFYEEQVSDINDKEASPNIISKESAKKRLLDTCKDDFQHDCANREFNKLTLGIEPYLIMIDGSLL